MFKYCSTIAKMVLSLHSIQLLQSYKGILNPFCTGLCNRTGFVKGRQGIQIKVNDILNGIMTKTPTKQMEKKKTKRKDSCGSVNLATFGNGPEMSFKWDYESVTGQQEGWLTDQSLVQMAFSSW